MRLSHTNKTRFLGFHNDSNDHPSYFYRQVCNRKLFRISRQSKAASMPFISQMYAIFVLVLLCYAFPKVDALNYANVDSGDGNFKLQWTYNNDKLTFNMTCKTTGWCAVGFTTSADGRNMVNYDIAVGGVTSNMTTYLDVS